MRSMVSMGNGGRPPRAWCAPRANGEMRAPALPRHDLVHLFEEDLLAGLLGQRVQAQHVLIHGAIVLGAWRCGRSAGKVLQTFPKGGGFNQSLQHTNHRIGGKSVADEAALKPHEPTAQGHGAKAQEVAHKVSDMAIRRMQLLLSVWRIIVVSTKPLNQFDQLTTKRQSAYPLEDLLRVPNQAHPASRTTSSEESWEATAHTTDNSELLDNSCHPYT